MLVQPFIDLWRALFHGPEMLQALVQHVLDGRLVVVALVPSSRPLCVLAVNIEQHIDADALDRKRLPAVAPLNYVTDMDGRTIESFGSIM